MPPRMRHGFGTNRYYASLLPEIVKNTTSFQGHGSGGRIRRADPNQRVIARSQPSLEVKCYVVRHAFAARGGIALGWL
jgi:hypothetical protein